MSFLLPAPSSTNAFYQCTCCCCNWAETPAQSTVFLDRASETTDKQVSGGMIFHRPPLSFLLPAPASSNAYMLLSNWAETSAQWTVFSDMASGNIDEQVVEGASLEPRAYRAWAGCVYMYVCMYVRMYVCIWETSGDDNEMAACGYCRGGATSSSSSYLRGNMQMAMINHPCRCR